MKKVGLTTSIPVEFVFAAGMQPVDLNNIFVLEEKNREMVEEAELEGFPRNLCTWIKGRYTAALMAKLDLLIGVYEGDCSNTKALLEVLESQGVPIYEFSYPKSKRREGMERELQGLMERLGTTYEAAEAIKRTLYPIRQKVKELDALTYKTDQASGFENHLYQVCCSDFNGDFEVFDAEITQKIADIKKRQPSNTKVRLGYMGVPPIITDIYDVVENMEGKIMFNEVQRQFSFSRFDIDASLEDMYLEYTYPYTITDRIKDVKEQIEERKLDGIIHYTQAFCYRGIEDILVKKELPVPILTIEGDMPGKLDSRTKIRLEAFVDMLKDLKE